jgi:hypothetical protein
MMITIKIYLGLIIRMYRLLVSGNMIPVCFNFGKIAKSNSTVNLVNAAKQVQ